MFDLPNHPITPNEANPLLTDFVETPIPVEISWWPQTVGWHIVLFIVVSFLLYRFYLVIQHYLSNAYRRSALAWLEQCSNESSDIEKLPQLIRKTALYAFNRVDVTPLTGTVWEQWLDAQCKGSQFSTQYSGVLGQLAYAPDSQLTPQQIHDVKSQIAFWIKHHRGHHD